MADPTLNARSEPMLIPGGSFFDASGALLPGIPDGVSSQAAPEPWQQRLNSLQYHIPEVTEKLGAYPDDTSLTAELETLRAERDALIAKHQPQGYVFAESVEPGPGIPYPGSAGLPAPAPIAPAGPPADIAGAILADQTAVRDRSSEAFLETFANVEDQADREAMTHDVAPDAGPSLARRVAGDVGKGVTEAGTQILGGVFDAAEAALDGIDATANWLNTNVADLGALQILDDEGNLDLRLISGKDAPVPDRYLPDVREAESVTGGLVRGVAQFLAGFVGGAKLLKGAGALQGAGAGAAAARGYASGAISDFAAFDGHEERLSNFLAENVEFGRPITEYLAADMDDGELEGRLKNVAEGALTDAAISGLASAVRSVRHARRARDGIGAESYGAAAERLARDPTLGRRVLSDVSSVRAPDAPLTVRAGATDAGELAAYLDRVTEIETRLVGGADDVSSEDAARALAFSRIETGSGDAPRPTAAPDPAGSATLPDAAPAAKGDLFINWAKIETPDDVRRVIQDMADADLPDIDAARRGVRTNVETAIAADDENAWGLLLSRRKGGGGAPLNAEKTLAMRRLWAASGDKVTAAARLAAEHPTPGNLFLFRRAMALHGVVQREVLSVRTETARALQQWSIPAGPNDVIARQIEDVVGEFGGESVGTDLARRIVAMADEGNVAGIDAMSRQGAGAATAEAVFEYWINARLSNPTTHLVNAGSNTMVALMAQLERATGSGLTALRGGTDGVEAGEALAMVHGLMQSQRDAWRNMAISFRTGESGFGLGKIEAPRTRQISSEAWGNLRSDVLRRGLNVPGFAHALNALGAIVSSPGRALTAADEYFKTVSYRMEVHAQAARTVQQELRSGVLDEAGAPRRLAELVDEPSEATIAMARDFAQYNTFTNRPGQFTQAIMKLRADVPGLRYIIPFTRTPANILRFAAERSPAAPILADVRADIRAGGRRADLALAKISLGSFTMFTAYDYAINGQISGGGPSDAGQLATLRRQGWQPYSVRVGDRWFAYNRLDPFGAQLGIAANIAELSAFDAKGGLEVDEAIYRTVGAVGQTMLDRTYLTGAADLFDVMSDPRRYSDRFFERLGASFMVPAGVQAIERALDPELRRATNIVDEIRSRTPGLSDALPARHDLWGRPIDYRSGLGTVWDAVSPIYSSRQAAEPIDEALIAMDYGPRMPQARLTISGEEFSLRNEPEAYERLVVLQGSTAGSDLPQVELSGGGPNMNSRRVAAFGGMTLMQALNTVVTGDNEAVLQAFYEVEGLDDGPLPEFGALDVYEQRDLVEKVKEAYGELAREQIKAEFPQLFLPGLGVRR